MIIRIRNFKGTLPGRSKRLLPENMAQEALNCKLQSGEIRPFRTLLRVNTPTKIGTKKTIYRWMSRTNQDANGTITGATQTNPVNITSANHGRTTGERIYVSGVAGMTQINHRTFTITVVNANTFSLNGENGTGYPAYTGGGTWVKENGYWFHWVQDVDVARSPIGGDTNERTIFTGDGLPSVTDATIATSGGGTDYPTNSFQLGLPNPNTAPTVRAVKIEAPVLDLYPGDVYQPVTTSVVGGSFPNSHPWIAAVEKALVVTDDTLGLKDSESARFGGVTGAGFVNDKTFRVTTIKGRIIDATQTNPVVVTVDEDLPLTRFSGGAEFADGDKVRVEDIGGMVELNGATHAVTFLTQAVTVAVLPNFITIPVRITCPGHGLSSGDRIAWDPGTWIDINGVRVRAIRQAWTVTVIDPNVLDLNNSNFFSVGGTGLAAGSYQGDGRIILLRKFNLGVDGTGFGAFSYPGKWLATTKFLLDETEGMGTRASLHGLTKTAGVKARTFSKAHGFDTGDRVIVKRTRVEDTDFSPLVVFGPYDITKIDDDSFDLEGSQVEAWTANVAYNGGTKEIGLITLIWNGGGEWTRRFNAEELVARSYVYTFVSVLGEEGPPSDNSDTVEFGIGQTAELTNLAPVPGGNFNVTAKRVYRTDPGLSGSDFRLVAEIAAAATTYTDTVADEDLGEALPSEEWIAPPPDLHSVAAMENGIVVGLSKNDIYFIEPYLPHAWPGPYRKTLPHNGIAVRAAGNTAVALTEHGVVLVTGNHPSQMADRDLQLNQVCVSKRGAASVGTSGVIFPSPDGLVLVGLAGHSVVTEGHLTRDEWQELNPSSIIGTVWEDRYIGFFTRKDSTQGGFIFDPKRPEIGLTFIDTFATAVYNDPVSDTLYLQVGDHIEAWDRGATLLPYTWRSKEYETPRRVVFTVGQVIAADYADLTFKLYRDGTLAYTKVVASERAFRLPGNRKGRRWEIELTGTSAAQGVAIAESPDELRKID